MKMRFLVNNLPGWRRLPAGNDNSEGGKLRPNGSEPGRKGQRDLHLHYPTTNLGGLPR